MRDHTDQRNGQGIANEFCLDLHSIGNDVCDDGRRELRLKEAAEKREHMDEKWQRADL